MAEELTIGFLIPAVALELSALPVLEGRAGDGLNLLPAANGRHRGGGGMCEALAELRMGEALFAAGRVDEARVAATRALDLARERGEQGHEAWALRLLGEIAADPAATAADRREGTIGRPSRWPIGSTCAPSSPTATSASASSTGEPATGAKAEEHLTTATAMYREMDMGFWLEKADAELGGVER